MRPPALLRLLRALACLAGAMLCCAAAPAGRLTPEELAGRKIYQEGMTPRGGTITALVGAGAHLPASALPCAGCHGNDGAGRPEGGIEPSNLEWSELTKPYGHVHRGGRRHPAFVERTVARAIIEGIDPGNHPLDPAMPRYSLSREDLSALIAYLRRLERERDPGITDTAIRIGAVLPSRGGAGRLGQAARQLLTACFEELNARGGIHGRRLELVLPEYDDGAPGAGLDGLRRLFATEPPFALVSGLVPGREKELAELVEREQLPLIGPLGLSELSDPAGASGAASRPPERQVFFTLPGLREQARALVDYAAMRLVAAPARVAIIHPAGEPLDEVARAALAQLERRHLRPVKVLRYERGRFDPALMAPLARAGLPLVVFLGHEAELEAFMKRAQALGWRPYVLVVSALATRAALAAPPPFEGRVFLSFPTLPSDEKPRAVAEFARLQARLPGGVQGPAERSVQVAAYIAAKVLFEGLRRAGRQLSRDRLIAHLEELYDFETGLGRRLSYGPGRRAGASGAYIVTVDPRAQELPPGGWK